MPREPLKPWEPFATVVSPALGGAAPSAPTTDAHMIRGLERCIAAAHRLLDEHHDATVADRQDAEDAARLLAVLRGGAPAPTPDDPTADDDLAAAVRQLLAVLPRPEFLTGWGAVYRPTLEPLLVERLRAGLRRDTGASHE